MASYIYYVLDKNIMADTAYDQLMREVIDDWENFEHRHKHLVDISAHRNEDGKFNCGSLAYIKKYPLIIQSASHALVKKLKL